MPILDVAAMNAALDSDYGSTRAAGLPSSHTLHLYVGDPMGDDSFELVEADNPGYAPATVLAAKWSPASGGFKSTNGGVQFADSEGEWEDEPTHWLLKDGGTGWDCAPLLEPLAVTAAGTGPSVVVTVFYEDGVLDPTI